MHDSYEKNSETKGSKVCMSGVFLRFAWYAHTHTPAHHATQIPDGSFTFSAFLFLFGVAVDRSDHVE